jgi:uncharacterized protein (TIGR02996 family)
MRSFLPDEFAVLHRAILENPFDDAPRYALADWYKRNGQATRGESLFRAVFNRELRLGPLPGPFGGRAIFQRGLVEAVALNLNTFLVHGAEIFSDHPITHVEFLDLDPEVDLFSPGSWGWVTGQESPNEVEVDLAVIDHNVTMLPDPLADEIEGRDVTRPMFAGKVYTSKEEALEALSRAAVRIGRKTAGLPPLVEATTMVTT